MKAASLSRRPPVPKPASYREFVDSAKSYVKSKGLDWRIALDSNGIPKEGSDWDLRELTDSHARNASRTNGFSADTALRKDAIRAGWSPALLPEGNVLSADAQDFIKAVIATKCRLKFAPRCTRHDARIYRKLFSVTQKAPWELSTEDLNRFLSLTHLDTKVTDSTMALVKLMNANLLSVNCPLEPTPKSTITVRLAAALGERKDSGKLPDKRSLYELARIVFRETPRSHQDCMRFCAIRLLILTGLRLNELLMLPQDCLRWEDNVDVVTGRPAAAVGGVSRSLRLRYFAEKHEAGAPDLLVEEEQWVPLRFHDAVVDAVAMALKATDELRGVLRRQHRVPRLYPRSDLRRFKTSAGGELGTADLLFLVIPGDRRDLQHGVREDEAIAPISAPAFYQAISGSDRDRRSTLFMRYGRSEAAHSMSVKPHSLRHAMNTEFFRLSLPDTIITQQFGRRSVAQTYEYDHRTLAERLAFVQLPSSARHVIKSGQPQELVAKMVVSGIAAGSHIGRTFKAIQAEHGDEAAFTYLAADSDGFHVTPYGFCTNSFSVNPCARHLKCFDRCRHFTTSGLPEHKTALEQLKAKLIEMRAAAASKPSTTLGRRNQIVHAEGLIAGVDAALAAQPKATVFSDGEDFSSNDADLFR